MMVIYKFSLFLTDVRRQTKWPLPVTCNKPRTVSRPREGFTAQHCGELQTATRPLGRDIQMRWVTPSSA